MNGLAAWLAANGLTLPGRADATELGVAGGVILVSLLAGLIAQRRFGERLAIAWRTRVAHAPERFPARIGLIVRHSVAALLLAIAVNAHAWPPLAAVPIGLALGAAAALTAHQLLRGLGLPGWTAVGVGVIVFVALFSRSIGGLEPITRTLDGVGLDVGRRRLSLLAVITAGMTAVLLFAAVRFANRLIAHSVARSKGLDPTQKLLVQKLAGIAVIAIAFFFGIDLLGIDLTVFALFSGGLGLAIGFGLQKTVGNLIAGIILLMDRSIKPGDVVVVGDSFGWVNKIGVRAVSVLTRDGKEHLIPNENLMTQEVENWSFSDRNVRVRIPVPIAYSADLRVAQDLMLRAALDSPRVLKSPRPNVWLTDFGNDGVMHEILCWISDPEGGVGNVKSDVLNRVWWLFREHGVEIPYAQVDLYVRSWPDRPA